jgi:hypothetical protein
MGLFGLQTPRVRADPDACGRLSVSRLRPGEDRDRVEVCLCRSLTPVRCVFYGDLYGCGGENPQQPVSQLDDLIRCRKLFA